jgi:hypothetical protein
MAEGRGKRLISQKVLIAPEGLNMNSPPINRRGINGEKSREP